MNDKITDTDIAHLYLATSADQSADALISWLDAKGLEDRNAHSIAIAINKLHAERAAFNDQMQNGTTADQVTDWSSMSLADYGKARAGLGIGASGRGMFS